MRYARFGWIGHTGRMSDRLLTEREAFRAARYFIEQFNERENSEALELLIGWMAEGTWDHPLETSDAAQWDEWVKSVDRVLRNRPVLPDERFAGASFGGVAPIVSALGTVSPIRGAVSGRAQNAARAAIIELSAAGSKVCDFAVYRAAGSTFCLRL
jgi:hypothetical protein